jgi:hypothetical protein
MGLFDHASGSSGVEAASRSGSRRWNGACAASPSVKVSTRRTGRRWLGAGHVLAAAAGWMLVAPALSPAAPRSPGGALAVCLWVGAAAAGVCMLLWVLLPLVLPSPAASAVLKVAPDAALPPGDGGRFTSAPAASAAKAWPAISAAPSAPLPLLAPCCSVEPNTARKPRVSGWRHGAAAAAAALVPGCSNNAAPCPNRGVPSGVGRVLVPSSVIGVIAGASAAMPEQDSTRCARGVSATCTCDSTAEQSYASCTCSLPHARAWVLNV